MAVLIKTFSDNSALYFDQGKFDAWCVYLVSEKQRIAPRDADYFEELQQLGEKYGGEKIYQDFVKIYDVTNAVINPKVLAGITRLASHYAADALRMDQLLTILYAGMIAEENKQFAKLKKRIKRLGMYQILVEKQSSDFAANFSKGKKWRELDVICRERGF